MAQDKKARDKARAYTEYQRERFAFLDNRIPQLHRLGYEGRTARTQADLEWGEQRG